MQEHLEQEFTAAFDRYADELFRHAYFRLSDRDKALELVQEAFMRSWNSARMGTKVRDMRAFLYRTLRHLIIDEYRRKKSSSLDALLENEEGSDSVLADERDEMAEAMDRLDGVQALALVQELPPSYAEVITLRYVDSLSPHEIAQRLDETENTISVRIHRALKALRTLYESRAS